MDRLLVQCRVGELARQGASVLLVRAETPLEDLQDRVSAPAQPIAEPRLGLLLRDRNSTAELFFLSRSANAIDKQCGTLSKTTSARWLDISLAGLAIIFFGPLMLAVAAAIWLTGGGPVIFRQKRIGLGGAHFDCFKFRTMRRDSEQVLAELLEADPVARLEWATSQKLRVDPRSSRLGQLLRKTSLDELPQLFNVLKGDMSVVGPRPIVPNEIARYGRYFAHYAAVKPGLTGVWQINGRNNTTYRRRVACDVSYSRSRTLLGDLSIIARTVPIVLFAKGAY
jgi:exopolysaccharide production protein ExoY